MIDVFAWIVLLILVASAIAIFYIAGSLPGHIAKSRGHPWAAAVTVARMGHPDLRVNSTNDLAVGRRKVLLAGATLDASARSGALDAAANIRAEND